MASGCEEKKYRGDCAPCNRISSDCVTYVGKEYPELGICTGDTITEDVEIILDKITEIIETTKFNTEIVDLNCDYTRNIIALKDKTVEAYFSAVFEQTCDLNSRVKKLESGGQRKITHNYNFRCLESGIETEEKLNQVLINKVCEIDIKVNDLIGSLTSTPNEDPNEPEDPSSLRNLIQSIVLETMENSLHSCTKNIRKVGTGENTKFHFLNQAPPGTLMWGNYPTNAFDQTGRGLESMGFCGWYLADGRNGTWDMRGFAAAGATQVTPSRALHPNVFIAGDATTSTFVGDIRGKVKVTLEVLNLPDHTHAGTITNAHSHSVSIPDLEEIRIPYSIVGGLTMRSLKANGLKDVQTSSVSASQATGGVVRPGGIRGNSNEAPGLSKPIDARSATRFGIWIQKVSGNPEIFNQPVVGNVGGPQTTVGI